MTTAAVIIPARYASIRFPGKPLALIAGRPMIQHVYERALKSRYSGAVFVAVDDRRVFECVEEFGGKAVMTSEAHPSGTDRIAEVVQKTEDFEIIVNVQGDEPFIEPQMIDDCIELLMDKKADMSTLVKKIDNDHDLMSPHVVKAVWDNEGFALYFSRSPIPFYRNEWTEEIGCGNHIVCYKHIGIYGYTKDALLTVTSKPQSWLEKAESLEQLRALASGLKIKVKETTFETLGVDLPGDIEKAEKWVNSSL
jgi:3-deoxy-manno-octulosonate cytidylyltransferase (CMP-KDO synthetase)